VLSKDYIQANSCANLHFVDKCDTVVFRTGLFSLYIIRPGSKEY